MIKIGLFLFSIRRYTVLCTLYVTARIIQFLTPNLFWLLGIIAPEMEFSDGVPANPDSLFQAVELWVGFALVVAIIVAVVLAFNAATAWLYGERRKS